MPCTAGNVVNSVLSRGCVVEPGAVVRDSVLLPGATVRAGATVVRSIVDDDVTVGPQAKVGGDGGITVLGLRVELPPGDTVPAGKRLPEVDS